MSAFTCAGPFARGISTGSSAGSQPTILYYVFRASDGAAPGYSRDDDPKFLGGGFGTAEPNQSIAYDNSYQISVFDPAFATEKNHGSGDEAVPNRGDRDGCVARLRPTSAGGFTHVWSTSFGGSCLLVLPKS